MVDAVLTHRPEQHPGEVSPPSTTNDKELGILGSSQENRRGPALRHDDECVGVRAEHFFDRRFERSRGVTLGVEAMHVGLGDVFSLGPTSPVHAIR